MFITFEGIEGSGKTLQILRSEAHLVSRGIRCMVTREPGGTEFGTAIRHVLLHEGGPPREPLCEMLLYLADRHQHLREVIEPALQQGIVVLCDRYHDATRAYQGTARGVSQETIDTLASLLRIPDPDVTILLDMDPESALSRARLRNRAVPVMNDEGRFEAEDFAFHLKVRQAYLDLATRFPSRIRIVDASGTPDEVFARIAPLLDSWVGNK